MIMPQEQQFVTKNPLFDAALSYAKAKHPIFPVKVGGKTPLTLHGLKDASVAVANITKWWQQWPQANIGLCTGAIAGFFVLDIDGEDGEASLTQLEQAYGLLPPTVEVITGGGGRHLYFQMPPHYKISCSAGKIGIGLDIRGDGGYIIAPPSIHPSGKAYVWSVDCANTLAQAPEWLLRLIQTPTTLTKQTNDKSMLELVKGVSEGQRNDSLARLAGKLLRVKLDPFISLELCLAWNDARCLPPLPHLEVIRTIDSIAQRELARKVGQ